MVLKIIILRYLLAPFLAMVLASIAGIVAKKNALLSKKRLIVFVLLAAITVAIPGLAGFTGADFFPWYYLLVQIISIGMGAGFVALYNTYIDSDVKTYKVLLQSITCLIVLLLGGYMFMLLFDFCSKSRDGDLSATSLISFPIPIFFYWAYIAFMRIPPEIYTVWQYPVGSKAISNEEIDVAQQVVLEVLCFRNPSDKARISVKAQAQMDKNFGQWFRNVIDDYNAIYPNAPITYLNDTGVPNDWIFYCKPSFFHWRRLLDPALSIRDNRIQAKVPIISRRVIERREETYSIT